MRGGLGYWQGRLDNIEVASYFGLAFVSARVGYEQTYQRPLYDYEANMVQINYLQTSDPVTNDPLMKAPILAEIDSEIDGFINPRFYRLGVF